MTDGIQGVTDAPWRLKQRSAVDTDFTLSLEDIPVPDWADAIVEVTIHSHLGQIVLTSVSDAGVTKQDQDAPEDPTIATATLTEDQTSIAVLGRYTVEVILDDQRLPYRVGEFEIEGTLPMLEGTNEWEPIP